MLERSLLAEQKGRMISTSVRQPWNAPNNCVGDVVGSQLGSQAQVIADILLEKAVPVVATDHWVRKVKILDDGLKLSLIVPGDLAPKIVVIFLGCPIVRLASSSLWPS